MKILHFADAHIDMANYGRHDPQSGLPLRVMDFLKSLDVIVDAAIDERVDLVVFAGDAYKDRSPAPTFQREWGRRIMRLSKACIPTLLVVGNHDLSPAMGRASSIEEFATLEVPYVQVVDRPSFLGPKDLEGLPLQVLALPWVSRSGLMAHFGMSGVEPARVYEELEKRLTDLIHNWLDQADPSLPTILAAHCSVQGALYGSERSVMLGADLVLPRSLVCDPRLDYVALGHIHKPQELNPKAHPPVIYPGSIERVDFGEAEDDKFFIVADVTHGRTTPEWRKLHGIRPFMDRYLVLDDQNTVNQRLLAALPDSNQVAGVIFRLTVEYPREWEPLIDEASLRKAMETAFEFHLVKRPRSEARIRLPDDQTIGSLSPLDLLEKYWSAAHIDPVESEALYKLAEEIITQVERDQGR